MQKICMTTNSIAVEVKRGPGSLTKLATLLGALGALCCAGAANAQVQPAAVIERAATLTTINGNAGHIAANTFGDAFFVSQTDNTAYWLPRGTTTPIALVTMLSGGRSVTVDANNNVYVSSNYSGRIIEVPYANGSYTTNTANSSGIPTCGTNPTAPCQQFNNGGGATGYYLQTADLGFDQLINLDSKSGAPFGPDAYVVDERDNVCNQGGAATSCNTILKFAPAAGSTYTASIVVTGLPQTNGAEIAVGPYGDVYYCDGTSLYYVAAGATTYTIIGSGLVSPTGVTTDKYGNLFITDSGTGANKIYEMPQVNGVAQPSKQFLFLPTYSANGVAFDGLGDIFYTGYSSQTTLNEAQLWSFNLGGAAIGAPVSPTAITLTVNFTGPITLGTLTLSGATSGFSYVAGTCATGTAYIAGSSCTINVNYTPTAVGLQKGAVTIANSTGGVAAIAELSGIGRGAAQTNDPGTLLSVGNGLTSPQGIAVDQAKNVYIADPGQNAVLMYPAGSSTGTKIGTGLSGPTSVAVDNAGNLYIADSGNGRVVEVPSVAGVLTTSGQTVVVTTYSVVNVKTGALGSQALGSSLGIALDLNNNLYVADANNKNVLRLGAIAGVPSSAAQSLLDLSSYAQSNFTAPIAIATDPTGNVFVADTTANTITEITYYGQQVVNIGMGYSHPSGLATDAAGSLYVADTGNGRLLKIPFESPIFNTNDQYSIGATIVSPYGVALDSAGNAYIVDSMNAAAYELVRTQGTLALGRAQIMTSGSASNANIGNSGNQTLNLSNPDYVVAGATPVFVITSPSGNGCNNSEAILPGFSCVLSVVFSPQTTGNYSETLAFTDNAANTTTPSLTITGVGVNLAPDTIVLTAPQGTAVFGQPVVITATISSAKAGTPTGTITAYVDGGKQSPPTTVNGATVAITLTGLTGGCHVVGASYTGDNSFAPSSAPTISVCVARTTTSTVLTSTGDDQSPASAAPGTAITLVATVTPSATTVPTGTVAFTVGSTLLGTANVVPTVETVSGKNVTIYQASLKFSLLPNGANAVVATYSGDVNYLSSSNELTITIAPISFTFAPTGGTTLTLTSGQTGTLNFQAISISGFAGYVGLSCTGLPANAACGFSPNGFALESNNVIAAPVPNPLGPSYPPLVPGITGPTGVILTLVTGTTPTIPQPPVGELRLPGFGRVPISLAFLALAPFGLLLRRRTAKRFRRSLQLFSFLLLLCTSVTVFSGCGSGLIGVTPKGTYTVTVNAVSTSTVATSAPGCVLIPASATLPTCTQSVQVTLVVQ